MSRTSLIPFLALLAACTGEPSTVTTVSTSPDAPDANRATLEQLTETFGSPDAAEAPPVVLLYPVGLGSRVPRKLALRSNHSAFGELRGLLPDSEAVRISPPTPGAFVVSGSHELTFTASEGLLPDTEYTVTVERFGVGDTELTGADGPWVHTFRTPKLELAQLSLAQVRVPGQAVDVDLEFTAPVEAYEVRERARFLLDGEAVDGVSALPGSDPYRVRLRLPDLDWDTDAELTVELAAGVPLATDGDVTAPAATRSTQLSNGPAMAIQSAKMREGGEGWYIEVFCDDTAVEQKMSYYDREDWDYYWLSTRCMLDEDDALSHVHVEPDPGDLSIAPGPAGFRIFGSFPRGDVRLRIDAGARTEDGGTLQTKWESNHRVTARSSLVSFVSKGRYLPRSAWKQLAVKHRNVEGLEVTVRHVPEDNLVFWMGGDEPLNQRTSDVVLQRIVRVDSAPDEVRTEWLDVAGWLPETDNGLYEIRVRGIEDLNAPTANTDDEDEAGVADTGFWWEEPEVAISSGGPVDASRLMLTDIQLVAKVAEAEPGARWAPKMTVFALDTHDNQPLSRTTVEVVRRSGKVMASCTTDARGGCTVDLPDTGPDDSQPFALIARRHGDMAYLKFTDLELDTPSDTEGEPWFGDTPYRASAWTDRGVYRPGEMAHVAAIVRDEALTAPADALPVLMKLYDPKGKELRRRLVEANDAGMVSADFAFADFATTGGYRVDVEVAERVVGSVRFNVEEFVPERMAVEAETIDPGYLASDDVTVDVEARWLFGGNAGGADVELSCRLVPSAFRPGQHKGYHYGLASVGAAPRPLDLGGRMGKLDEDGRATITCDAAEVSGGLDGPARLVANAAVFEGESGRTTVGTASVPVHPESYYVGLSTSASKAEPGKPFAVEGVVVDWDGALDPGAVSEVEVELVRLVERYGYTWDEATGRSRYQRVLRRSREESLTVPVRDGKLKVELTPEAHAAGYLVVAKSGDTRTELHIEGTGRRWWWSNGTASVDQTPRPDKPTDLNVRVPTTQVEVGSTVPVHVTAPYAGRMLFTVETHEVVLYEWHEVDAGEVEWSFSLDDFAPNVYVSAMLVKDPHLESEDAYLPDRAYGVANVPITPSEFVHDLKLIVPPEVRPRQPLRVDIDLGPQDEESWVAVAAVDEGVLSLTDFESPNPFDDIFAQRELGVRSYETVGWSLLVPPMGPSSRTGGDEAGGQARVQMVKPVALWSGLVKVPESGQTHVELDVPGYQGELRVMAVSAGSKRMGHASKSVTVRDPLVLQPTLPRFLTEGDRADIPVFVSNVSGAKREVEVRLSVEEMEAYRPEYVVGELDPVVAIDGEAVKTVTLEDGASATVLFQVAVNRAPTAARFRVVADAGEVHSWDELEVPIQTAAPEVRMTETLELHPGENTLAMAFSGWTHGTDRSQVWVTSNPYGEAMNHLSYVVRYPYGCVEQTSSSTRPLLYVRNFVDEIDPSLSKQKGSVDDMVNHGVNRLLSMQTPSGGLGYWPGTRHPHPWASALGGHVLIDAREAGYDVPAERIDEVMDWLVTQVDSESDRLEGIYDHRRRAYMHYVLARAGRGRPAKVQAHLDELGNVLDADKHDEARYLYMAAMYLAGDRRHETSLRRPGADEVDFVRLNDDTFYSDLRDRAMTLNLYVDLFGTDPAGQALADRVGSGLSELDGSHWYTTQEIGWGLSGLGKWVNGQASGELDGTQLMVDGKAVPVDEQQDRENSWQVSHGSLASTVTVDLPEHDFDGRVFAVVTTEGTREGVDIPTGGNGLAVARNIVTADGTAVDEAELGEPLYAVVSLTNTRRSSLRNVALVDRIPAGLEIENPRLGRGAVPETVYEGDHLWTADHMNLRDDRVEIFGTIPGNSTRYVVYGVRAVTAGEFAQPPVSAEAMYDPTRWARELGATFVVHAPWEDES